MTETFYICPKCGGEAVYKLVGDETYLTCHDCGFWSGDDDNFDKEEIEE